ncbi:trehalase [Halalkalibacter wakoensis JCM 9140]|uniref:Trehalase n=1 Tax=Halalkalibacter wakoensis JCM 9140 TaxID=1236970 RepID=W4Q2Y4_9BACI|nr:trehalase family glycosidase [Halalkalibacter wakoensis]GAE25734.1 trehalase [Halalkalibacter wakoensis JCM 9140]
MDYELPVIEINCSEEKIEKTLRYIHKYWKELIVESPPFTKGQLFYLPHPYVVPGGVFQQLFYWDSYFTLLGLKISKLDRLARGIVDNFLYQMKTFGIIPNSSEVAHLSRSQPPFLTSMIKEVWDEDLEWLKYAYEIAKLEYFNVWMNPSTHYHREIGLNRYFDDLDKMLRIHEEAYLHFDEMHIPPQFWQERTEAESGWDYTGRFHRECGHFIPVELNSLLYKYETDLSEFASILGRGNEIQEWKNRARKRKQLMNHYLWSDSHDMYFDYNFIKGKQYVYPSLATFFPLWAGVADRNQAELIQEKVNMFLVRGGMATSIYYTSFQWDYPNGWAPLQWIVISGLKRYGYNEISIEIARRWVNLCTDQFMITGKMYEKYNVVDYNINTTGRYPLQEGFGWTNAIYQKLAVELLNCKID